MVDRRPTLEELEERFEKLAWAYLGLMLGLVLVAFAVGYQTAQLVFLFDKLQ